MGRVRTVRNAVGWPRAAAPHRTSDEGGVVPHPCHPVERPLAPCASGAFEMWPVS